MLLTKLKDIALYGSIGECRISHMATIAGWVVSIEYRTKTGKEQDTITLQRGGVRSFKTVDSAVSALRSAGITTSIVDSSGL